MKMYAADFRKIARDSLRGRWLVAVLTTLVAGLLGGTYYGGGSGNSSNSGSSGSGDLGLSGTEFEAFYEIW